MHLELLIEDRSGAVVMQNLLPRMLEGRSAEHTYAIRPHRGLGKVPRDPYQPPARFASGLLDLLPAKSRAYKQSYYPEELLIIIIVDSDTEQPEKVFSTVQSVMDRFAGAIPYVIGVSVEEMEAWLMGDQKAVLEAYPDADKSVLANYAQDSVCGTWEVLAHALYGRQAKKLIRLGYPAVGQYKHEWARRIAPLLDPDRNKSPSFKRFQRAFNRILGQQEHKAEEHRERVAAMDKEI
ncbi:MAG: DUF4276 family protein [Ruminococcaceae bacterium]|nr:DUF4276 family protein [Oscillospiraceae bacterium]